MRPVGYCSLLRTFSHIYHTPIRVFRPQLFSLFPENRLTSSQKHLQIYKKALSFPNYMENQGPLPVSASLDRTKKETVFRLSLLVREAGLEPARAYCTLEPESSESANSTTRACSLNKIPHGTKFVNKNFQNDSLFYAFFIPLSQLPA